MGSKILDQHASINRMIHDQEKNKVVVFSPYMLLNYKHTSYIMSLQLLPKSCNTAVVDLSTTYE